MLIQAGVMLTKDRLMVDDSIDWLIMLGDPLMMVQMEFHLPVDDESM
jgi:hypothetical protein